MTLSHENKLLMSSNFLIPMNISVIEINYKMAKLRSQSKKKLEKSMY